MTHGTIHITTDDGTKFVLHTCHDGHTAEAFSDCSLMPFHLVRLCGGKNWGLAELYESANRRGHLSGFIRDIIPLQTSGEGFASWVCAMRFNRWFPVATSGYDAEAADYFGMNGCNVLVHVSGDRLPKITVSIPDPEYREYWPDIRKAVEKGAGEMVMYYEFDDERMAVSYPLDIVFGNLVAAL